MAEKKFVFFESFYEALEECTAKEAGAAVKALCRRVFEGKKAKDLWGKAADFYGMAVSTLELNGDI